MLFSREEDIANKYIRVKIKEARQEANETQEDLAFSLEKTRVAVSDLERGRVNVNAADLAIIAAHYGKPISYFFPVRVTVNPELSKLEEELITYFRDLPDTQQFIVIEYIKQLQEVLKKAFLRNLHEEP
jgi:transcriptional regulator with XRE-family HTH domain